MPEPKRPKPSTYTPAPQLAPELTSRYELVLKVLTGQLSVSEAARQAGLPRNHFQHLMHRAQAGLIEGLSPRPTGRPAKPSLTRQLEHDNKKLRQRTEVLEKRLGEQDSLLLLASQLIRDRVSTAQGRAKRTRKTKTAKIPDEDGPPVLLEHAGLLRRLGLSALIAAALVGVSAPTLRRWRGRLRARRPLVVARGPATSPLRDDDLGRQVAELVRRSRGLFGADSLRHAVPGVSRREALAIKKATLTAMERERKSGCGAVRVTELGVVRGFDAMHLPENHYLRYALCAGDACVPYTTSVVAVARYDGPAVASALDEDFSANQAPLVIRLDRASCHKTADVLAVCDGHGVLVLHGPPRHPRFYGQLERQNRDRRVWLNSAPRPPPNAIASELEQLRVLLNSAWSRRTLHWQTAEERWRQRPRLSVDRTELRLHVAALTARFTADLKTRAYDGLARRLAIEVALTQRGFLRRDLRAPC